MADPFVLSVLDQSPVSEGSTGADALRNTLDLARLADELGYHRYWLAEHHGGGLVAGPSPEVLIARIGAATEEMRLGSGGVVRDPALRRAALGEVAAAARALGLVLRDAVASPLPGPSGNVEYFLRLVRDVERSDAGDDVLDRAVAEGPR